MKNILKNHPIIRHLIHSYLISFLIIGFSFVILYGILQLTGVYPDIERALDLKYNSPFIIIPLYGFAALAVLCFVIGFLLYFYKYKRSKRHSKFHKELSRILN